jgi:hypothetical protein
MGYIVVFPMSQIRVYKNECDAAKNWQTARQMIISRKTELDSGTRKLKNCQNCRKSENNNGSKIKDQGRAKCGNP